MNDSENVSRDIEQALAGDREARERLGRRCLPLLKAYVHGRLGKLASLEQTDDVVQSALADMYEALPRLKLGSRGALEAYLHAVAENRIRDKIRYYGARKRQAFRGVSLEQEHRSIPMIADLLLSSAGPATRAANEEDLELLRQCLRHLSAQEVEVVRLKATGYSVREIGKRLGVPPTSVWSLLQQAMARLTGLMRDGCGPSSDA